MIPLHQVLALTNDKITLKLREEFNPMDYIKVLSYEGDVINSDVKVEHNVDTSKQGIYEVKYTIIHNEGLK